MAHGCCGVTIGSRLLHSRRYKAGHCFRTSVSRFPGPWVAVLLTCLLQRMPRPVVLPSAEVVRLLSTAGAAYQDIGKCLSFIRIGLRRGQITRAQTCQSLGSASGTTQERIVSAMHQSGRRWYHVTSSHLTRNRYRRALSEIRVASIVSSLLLWWWLQRLSALDQLDRSRR
jgi:hypothetical protein